MPSLDVFIGTSPAPSLNLSSGLFWYLSSHGFSEFREQTDISISLDLGASFDAEILLAFFLALEPVLGDLRKSDAEHTMEVGLDESQAQIVAYEVASRGSDSRHRDSNDRR